MNSKLFVKSCLILITNKKKTSFFFFLPKFQTTLISCHFSIKNYQISKMTFEMKEKKKNSRKPDTVDKRQCVCMSHHDKCLFLSISFSKGDDFFFRFLFTQLFIFSCYFVFFFFCFFFVNFNKNSQECQPQIVKLK